MRPSRRAPRFLPILACALLLSGCCRPPAHTITQVSPIAALLAGAYDGQVTCAELLRRGDLGIGTFDRLDGEMVVLDGAVYQACSDGAVRRAGGGETTPFAAVTRFSPSVSAPLAAGTDLKGLEGAVDRAFPDMNLFCAVRVRGRFSAMKVRSVPPQAKPYPPLAEAAKRQTVFERSGTGGTLVGFRSPRYAEGIAVPGYHLHFLSDDRTFGGHVLDFALESGIAELDPCTRLMLVLPGPGSAFAAMDLGGDRTAELERAERDPGGAAATR